MGSSRENPRCGSFIRLVSSWFEALGTKEVSDLLEGVRLILRDVAVPDAMLVMSVSPVGKRSLLTAVANFG